MVKEAPPALESTAGNPIGRRFRVMLVRLPPGGSAVVQKVLPGERPVDAADLPLITQIVLAISTFASSNWPVILIVLIVGAFALRTWGRTDTGRLALDRLKLRLPFLGPVLHRFAM